MLVVYSLSAQIYNDKNYSQLNNKFDSLKSNLDISYNVYYSSNSFTNSFLSSIYNDSYISNEDKNLNNISENNILGSQENFNLSYIYMPDSILHANNIGYRIAISHHKFNDLMFSEDAYNLLFKGNKMFAGDTAFMNNSNYKNFVYQEIEFGLFSQSKTLDKNNLTFYFGMSLIKVQEYNSLYFGKTSLFTEETGEYVELNANVNYLSSDSNYVDLYKINGVGTSINTFLSYTNNYMDYRVDLSVNNLGFIYLMHNSFSLPIDTSIRFDGIVVEDIFNISEDDFNGISKDSLTDYYKSKKSKKNFYQILPNKIHLSVTKMLLNKKLEAKLGFGYISNSNINFPIFYSKVNYIISPKFSSYMQYAYGGYSTHQFGYGFKINLKNQYVLSIGSSNIIGLFIPSQTFSQSFYLNFSYRF